MNKRLGLQMVLGVLTLIVSACGGAAATEEPGAGQAAAHWEYEGEGAPEHWGDLDTDYATCKTGQSQSPIDINVADFADLGNVSFEYQASAINILNNGHTAQVNYDEGSAIEFDGRRYDLVQFHYHAPSEHTIDGKSYPAELHLVHRNADGELAVVGLLIEEGAANEALQPFIANLPPEESEVKTVPGNMDAAGLLPAAHNTVRYSGSLTTPPCSEGVSWFVMTAPIQASAEQLAALTSVFEHANNRPAQELNGRVPAYDFTD